MSKAAVAGNSCMHYPVVFVRGEYDWRPRLMDDTLTTSSRIPSAESRANGYCHRKEELKACLPSLKRMNDECVPEAGALEAIRPFCEIVADHQCRCAGFRLHTISP